MSLLNRIKLALEARVLPDALYVKRRYRKKLGEELDLDNPQTFSEKLQWLKIYYRNDLVTKLADKYDSKFIVEERIGKEYVMPTHSIYDKAEDIKLSDLPQKFALKATHGSGWNIIKFNHDEVTDSEIIKYFNFWLKRSYYPASKEWAYKHIKPRVICEELVLGDQEELPYDYKVFCFNGEPKFLCCVKVDANWKRHYAYLTLDWELAPFYKRELFGLELPDKPKNLNEMISISKKLSLGLPFVRVDLYNVKNKIYVGELTFYPDSGFIPFKPLEWEKKLGNLIDLPID